MSAIFPKSANGIFWINFYVSFEFGVYLEILIVDSPYNNTSQTPTVMHKI